MLDYEIVVRTKLEGDALRRAHDELDRLNGQARSSVPAHDAAAQAATKHAHSHRELHIAAHSLVGRFPHLTGILWAFRSPLVAGGLAIGVFIEWCQKLREEWRKIEDSSADLATKLTLFEGALKHPQDGLRETERAARALKEALDEVAHAALDPVKKLGEAEKGLDQQLEREKEILKLRKEKVSAKIEGRVARGEITEAEGERLKGAAGIFFGREEARIEDEARASKMDKQARAHMAAQQDFRGALDANEQAVRDLKETKDKLAVFEKVEKAPGGQAETRAKELETAQKEEQEALAEQSNVQRHIADVESRGGLVQNSLRRKANEADQRVAAARGAIGSLKAVGQAQEEKHKDLASGVEAATQFEKETVRAAAGAKSRAEATRFGVVELGRERTTMREHSQTTDSLRAEIAAAQGEKAEAEQARREALELLRQRNQDEKELWREIGIIHSRQAAQQGR
jgi:hypothetical protein